MDVPNFSFEIFSSHAGSRILNRISPVVGLRWKETHCKSDTKSIRNYLTIDLVKHNTLTGVVDEYTMIGAQFSL